ncbi:MAG: superoxide dismutase family protein [Caulobacter sp.]|nr:superoxide dismutase family protein [Caulobacter sp.]
MHRFTIALAAAAIALPALAQPASLTVDLKGPAGEDMGVATLTEGPRGVLLRVEGRGLKPGWHGLHFHQKGDCSGPDFKSAGSHVHDQDAAVHGLFNPAANEAGDLPNVWATSVGIVNAEVFTTWVSLTGAEGRPALLDADGSALVIHAGPDDHASQPIGGAGARVACAVIKAP